MDQTAPPARQSRNWWMPAFFVALFLFECAREWAVIAAYEPPKIAVSASVDRVQTLVKATGSWRRMDEGSKLLPGAATITCYEDQARCYEVSYSVFRDHVGAPELNIFDAKFSQDAVIYENVIPGCARYSVRIDLRLEKTFAVRDRDNKPSNPNCAAFEPKVQMTLENSWGEYRPEQAHFLPVASLLRALSGG